MFLGWLKSEEDKVQECSAVLSAAKQGKVGILTSSLTITEVLNLKGAKNKIGSEDRAMVRKFFESDFISIYDVDRTVAEKAQDVVWDWGVKPKDAIHIATAMCLGPHVELEQFDTFDGDLLALDGQIGQPALPIGRPTGQMELLPESGS